MGNKPLENAEYDPGSRTNRSNISVDSNKVIVSMLQRVHTQMENESIPSITSNEKSQIMQKSKKHISNKQEFADTQQLFQNNSMEDSFGGENYFSANEHSEIKPGIGGGFNDSKGNSNFSLPFTINNIFSKQNASKPLNLQTPKINCNFEQRFFSLPENVSYIIISCIMDHYNTLTSISPKWYLKINEIMEENLIQIDNDFIHKHLDILSFKKSYFSITPLKLSKLGFRIDRNIFAEVFPCLEGKTVILKYYYEVRNKGLSCAEFRFDVVKRGSRVIWIYKENFTHNFDKNKLGFIQPIIPVFSYDNIKIAINFFNPTGLIDITKLKWEFPVVEKIPNIPKPLANKRNFTRFELDRICELETIHFDWIDPKYIEGFQESFYKILQIFKRFEPQLYLLDIKGSSMEKGSISIKVRFKATNVGLVEDSGDFFGVNLEIIEENEEAFNEVKRYGLVFDLEENLLLKIGDVLIFYISGIKEKI